MKLWKTLTSLLLAAAMLLGCAGCMTRLPDEPEENPSGRYVETDLGRPGNSFPMAVGMVDGNMRVLTSTGLYEARYGGAVWDAVPGGSPILADAQEQWTIISGCFTPEGGVLVCTARWGEPDENGAAQAEGYDYTEIDGDGGERAVSITLPEDGPDDGTPFGGQPTTAAGMETAPDGSILIRSVNGSLHRFDRETGERLNTYSCDMNGGFLAFTVVDGTLVTIGTDGSALYDYETGERLDGDPVLDQFITGIDEDGNRIRLQDEYGTKTLGGGGVLFTCPEEEGYLYMLGHNGIFRHLLGGSMIQQVVAGEFCSLMSPTCQVTQAIKTGDDRFIAACSSTGSSGPGLLQYAYDPDVLFFPEVVLKVYTVYSDYTLQEAIAEYQKEHGDVYLVYQVGVNFEAGMTADDAIRNLNTDIMNGEGPDILLLNDMPMDAYTDKGVLMDLTDIKDELLKEEDLFENILTTYERDGKICALTSHFSIPLMYAPRDVLDRSADLASLADEIVRLRFENPAAEQDCVVGSVFPGVLLDQLYPACAPAWEKEDGSVDRERLADFLKEAKRAWDAEDRGRDHEKQTFIVNVGGNSLGAGVRDGSCLMALTDLDDVMGLASVTTTAEDFPDYSYKPMPGQAENVFVPKRSVGILSGTEHPEVAKDFVKSMFSRESQEKSDMAGLPVHREALMSALRACGNRGYGPTTAYTEEGEPVEIMPFLKLNAVPEEDIDRIVGIAESLDAPMLSPTELRDAVYEYGAQYLSGTATLEDALDSIMSQADLYLAERQ